MQPQDSTKPVTDNPAPSQPGTVSTAATAVPAVPSAPAPSTPAASATETSMPTHNESVSVTDAPPEDAADTTARNNNAELPPMPVPPSKQPKPARTSTVP